MASDAPCCDVGELVALDDPTHVASTPVVAWNGSAWAVAWSDVPYLAAYSAEDAFVTLGPDAHPIAPRTTIEGLGYPLALAWSSGRYLIAATVPGWPPSVPSYVGVLTPGGSLAQVALVPDTVRAVSRYPAANAWATATSVDLGGEDNPVRVRLLDDALETIGDAIDIGTSPEDAGVALVALKGLFVALVAERGGIVQHTFEGRDTALVSRGPVYAPGTYLDEARLPRRGFSIAATRLRDTVVVVSLDATHVTSGVYDPFGRVVTHGPTVAAASAELEGIGAAADDVGGTVGVCYPFGANAPGGYVGPPRTNADALRFVLLGPDGAALGEPVTIVSGLTYAARCAVAAAGEDDYVVILWNAASDATRPSILAAHVHVRRP